MGLFRLWPKPPETMCLVNRTRHVSKPVAILVIPELADEPSTAGTQVDFGTNGTILLLRRNRVNWTSGPLSLRRMVVILFVRRNYPAFHDHPRSYWTTSTETGE
jgi:hypothetical protein